MKKIKRFFVTIFELASFVSLIFVALVAIFVLMANGAIKEIEENEE